MGTASIRTGRLDQSLPPSCPLPQTPDKAESPWHSIFYFLKLYMNVKYLDSQSVGGSCLVLSYYETEPKEGFIK